jgi:hypothetical protein
MSEMHSSSFKAVSIFGGLPPIPRPSPYFLYEYKDVVIAIIMIEGHFNIEVQILNIPYMSIKKCLSTKILPSLALLSALGTFNLFYAGIGTD